MKIAIAVCETIAYMNALVLFSFFSVHISKYWTRMKKMQKFAGNFFLFGWLVVLLSEDVWPIQSQDYRQDSGLEFCFVFF